jgi:hypothetical protein
VLSVALALVSLVAIPILLLLAWRGWTRSVRAELPAWRNGLCISALLLLFLDWLGAVVLEVPILVNPRMTRPAGLMEDMLTLSHPLCVIVIVLAFSFRRVPRIQAVLAGLLMLVSWPMGYASAFSEARPGELSGAVQKIGGARSKKPSEGSRWRGGRGPYGD